MTSELFKEWLLSLDQEMRQQRRKILLFTDNCSAHTKAAQNIQLRNVELIFLPPNSTSRSQPLDQGIIRSFKANYRKRVMLKILAAFDSGKLKRGDDTNFIDLMEATVLTHAAWQAVTPTVISNCFRHAGFSLSDTTDSEADAPDDDPEDDNLESLWEAAADHLDVDMSECTTEDYIAADDDALTMQEITADEIVAQVVADVETPGTDSESDIDDSQPLAPAASRNDAHIAVMTIHSYLASTSSVPSQVLKSLANVENFLTSESTRAHQCKLTDFFAPAKPVATQAVEVEVSEPETSDQEHADSADGCFFCEVDDGRLLRQCPRCSRYFHHACQNEDEEGGRCNDCFTLVAQ